MHTLIEVLKFVWAFPTSSLGYILGILGLLTGGKALQHGAVIEFHGGFVKWFMNRFPNKNVLAMTLGYVIIGKEPEGLEAARDHEMVHVKQNGIWGPFFLPAYGIASIVAWWRGLNPYRDNMFEREAYSLAPVKPIRRKLSSNATDIDDAI